MATNQNQYANGGGYHQPSGTDGRYTYDQQGLMTVNDDPGLETVPQPIWNEQNQQTWNEQKGGYGGYALSQQQQPMLPEEQPLQVQPKAPPEKRIVGMRPMTFWLALLSGILLAAVIGAGAAAGVIASQKIPGECSDPAQESGSSQSSASSASSASPTAFVSLPLPPEGTPGRAFPKCPGAHNSKTKVNGTDLVFHHECGINYSGNDMGEIPLMKMEDCVLHCAAQNIRPQRAAPGCVGVSWEYGDGWLGCFLKSGKGEPSERRDTESAFLI